MDQTTATRCNWCGHPLIFHSSRRTRWHSFLCGLAQLPHIYELKSFKPKEKQCEE
jgi:hypothetical protein